jgi:hypothetical protein
MSTWQETTLGAVATIKHGWPFKSECMVDQQEGKPIVVSIGNFNYAGGFRETLHNSAACVLAVSPA